MATTIKATVGDDYSVSTEADNTLVSGCVELPVITAELCEDLKECATVYVVYYNDSLLKPIRREYSDGSYVASEAISKPGNLIIGFVGYDADGVKRVPTVLSGNSIRIQRGADDGIDGREVTPDDLTRILNLVEELEDSEAERAATFEANEESRASTFSANESSRASAFSHAQDLRQADYEDAEEERESGFESAMASYSRTFQQNETSRYAQSATAIAECATATTAANTAAATANTAATAAENAADDLAQRVQAGEFNGAAFSIKYTPASVEEMEAITTAKQGEFACITSDVEDPDNSKLYMYGNGAWNYITDLSGATGLQGPQGVQGVSFVSSSVDGTKVYVTRYDPATKQTTTTEIGDFAEPIEAAVDAEIDERFVVVDELPATLTDGLIYMVRE